jgi:CBS domain-containing protein
MRVSEIMTASAVTCRPEMNLAQAVQLIWERNVGILPVVDEKGTLVGVLTDRDICIALGTRNRLAAELLVSEVAMPKVYTCKSNEDVHEALQLMSAKQVRRLPVINEKGVPVGVLSMDDLVLHSEVGKLRGACDLSSEEVTQVMKRVYGIRYPVVKAKAAVH